MTGEILLTIIAVVLPIGGGLWVILDYYKQGNSTRRQDQKRQRANSGCFSPRPNPPGVVDCIPTNTPTPVCNPMMVCSNCKEE